MANVIYHLFMHNDITSVKENLYKYAFPNCTEDKTRRKWYKIVTKCPTFANLYSTATPVAAL